MCLMRSYSFGVSNGLNSLPSDVLDLFTGIDNKKINYVSEIVTSALNGNISKDGNFNIEGYSYKIGHYKSLSYFKRCSKELHFEEHEDDKPLPYGTTTIGRVSLNSASKLKTAYDDILDGYELKEAIQTLYKMRPTLAIEERVDIIEVIRGSLKHIPTSIQALKRVCSEFELLGEQIELILKSGRNFEELLASVNA